MEDYFLGGRNMRSWTVGLSLFATLLSTITYLATPGEVIKHGPMILAGVFSVPIVMWVVGWYLIPAFMKVPFSSAYEILEVRLGVSIRILGTVFFLSLRLIWMAMVIYLTSTAIVGPVIGLDPSLVPIVSLLLGVITVVYTSVGGLRAVVFADVLQTFILFGGAILTIALISIHFHGFSWVPTEWSPSWDPPKFWFDTDVRMTISGSMTLFFIWYVCTAGGDQMAIQRYLATNSLKAARRAFQWSLLATVAIQLLLMFLGFALLSFYSANKSVQTDQFLPADLYFPHFITHHLPIGISGLVVAALLAAAMSSLSSGLSAACSVVSVDLVGRFSKKQTVTLDHLANAKATSWLLGLSIVLISMVMGQISGNFTELTNKASIFVAPLFYLFFMALFVPSATVAGTWIGAVSSLMTAIGIAFFDLLGLSFIWIIPGSLIAGIVLGFLSSLIHQQYNRKSA
jgi:SSS family solute:Na+ symporter